MIVAIRFSPELRQRAHSVLLIGVVVAVCLAVTLFFNASRYRIVIVPVLAVFAAHGGWVAGAARSGAETGLSLLGVVRGLVLSALVVNSPVRLATDGIDFRADFVQQPRRPIARFEQASPLPSRLFAGRWNINRTQRSIWSI